MIFRFNKKKELVRKVIHVILGLAAISNMQFDVIPLKFLVVIYVLGVVTFIVLNTVKLPGKWREIIFSVERQGVIGAGFMTFFTAYFALHIISTVDVKFQNLALASMCLITFGDGFSAIFGIAINAFKLPYNESKNWIGFTLGSIFAIIACSVYVNPLIAAVVVLTSMFIESLDIEIRGQKIDDNLMLPILSFGLFHLLTSVFN